mmetsp:Transcript_64478/g.171934  ORF Transcript_64478/g.171934 Transcript_64478/m.171934 type:complete len:225 (-) Transcript_64478:154-828(-)
MPVHPRPAVECLAVSDKSTGQQCGHHSPASVVVPAPDDAISGAERSGRHDRCPQPDRVDGHPMHHALLVRQRSCHRVACVRLLGDEQHEAAASCARECSAMHKRPHLGKHPGHRLRFRVAHHLFLIPVCVKARPHGGDIGGQQRVLHCVRILDEGVHVGKDGRVGGEPAAEDILQQVACQARFARVDEGKMSVEQLDRLLRDGQHARLDGERQCGSRRASLDRR